MPIVEAVGISVSKRSPKAARKERAMREAVEQALRQGVSDSKEIQKRMLEARDKVRA